MPPTDDLTNVLLDGRYRLVRLMGEGGMGQVYEGIHETLDRKVAVKVLLPRYAYEPKFRERFLREAKAASKVRHPNVVQILDFGDTPDGSVYFTMDFLEGRDLAALLRAEGRLPWPRARNILLQALGALAAAHERKIIHRDIKPANFFIEDVGPHRDLVKVLDFGIAKLAVDAGNEGSSLAQSLTGTGEIFGTAKYMAPEQAYGVSNDPRVDVYSLGIVAYELLTGEVPFTGASAFQVLTRHVNERPRPPRELVPELPPAVEAWILRALAKHPSDRFASMVEMEQALLEIPTGMPMEQPSMHGRSPLVPAPGSAQPWPVGDMGTAPPPARPFDPAPGRIPATSVMSQPVEASTARLQGAGDTSTTGPTWGSATETDVLRRPADPLRSGFVLGLLGTLGAVAAVLVGYLVVTSSEDGPVEPAPAVEPSKAEAAEASPAIDDRSVSVQSSAVEAGGGSAAPSVPVEEPPPVEASPTSPVVPDPEPEEETPAEPVPTPATASGRKPTGAKPPKPSAPLTDADVAAQLARTLKKKCGALGNGVKATVSVAVGSKGTVLSKVVRGATGELKDCLASGVAKAKFPAGKTRTVPVEVSF